MRANSDVNGGKLESRSKILSEEIVDINKARTKMPFRVGMSKKDLARKTKGLFH
jgi:hypothetical protein